MKIIFIAIIVVVLLISTVFFYLAVKSRSGTAAGIQLGHLIPCADSPNCISSEYPADTEHFISPAELPVNINSDIMTLCQNIITTMGGSIQELDAEYLSATFSSPLFGFIDDFEIRIDQKTAVLHLRAAARVGHSDFGINRKRAVLFKQMFMQQVK